MLTILPICQQPGLRGCTLHPQTDLCWLQREIDGREYYEFEFASKAKTYIRYALAAATVGNGEPLQALQLLLQIVLLLPPSCLPESADERLGRLAAGKFYVLQTGCNEKRWSAMKDNLATVVKSFQVEDRQVQCQVVQQATLAC